MREKLIPMVEQVFRKMNKEYDIGIHKKTVEEIADYLDIFPFASLRDEKLALLYACRINCEMADHIMTSFGKNKDCYHLYNNIEYIVKRLMIINGVHYFNYRPIETDDYLESKISFLENNYIIEKNKGKPNKKVYQITKFNR